MHSLGGKKNFAAAETNGWFGPKASESRPAWTQAFATAALATNLTLVAVINAVGIGFQRGTHSNWQVVTNYGTGGPTLTDMGASFALAIGGVLTLFIAAAPNAASVWVRAVNEVTGTVYEREITTDLPASTQFLSPRFYLNTGATATAVAYDCAGLYLETDY